MRTESKFEGILKDLRSKAKELPLCDSGEAVPIRELSSVLNVKKVVFRPLLADALLTRLRDGFGIHVNCRSDQRELLTDLYETEGCFGYPNWLPARIRFTLAHELAHVIVEEFACNKGGVGPLFANCGRDVGDLLEISCNKIAAELLLPSRRLESMIFGLVAPSEPLNVALIAERFKVSPEVVIHQLGHYGKALRMRYWKGAVYLVDFVVGEGWSIVAKCESKISSIGKELTKDSAGEGLFLGYWDGEPQSTPTYCEILPRHIKEDRVKLKCLTQEMWRSGNKARYLISINEAMRSVPAS